MAATIATITPYLKEVYQGRIREQLNNDTKTLKRILRSSAGVTNEVNGKYVTFPVHTTRNSGIGSRLEMEPLPVPGQQGYAAARLALKYGYSGVQLTGQAISLSDSDPKAFAKALDQEMDGLKNDVQKDMNRQVYGDGTGAIGVVSAITTAATITVSDARLFQRRRERRCRHPAEHGLPGRAHRHGRSTSRPASSACRAVRSRTVVGRSSFATARVPCLRATAR
jgi:hypothetical protein